MPVLHTILILISFFFSCFTSTTSYFFTPQWARNILIYTIARSNVKKKNEKKKELCGKKRKSISI